ncbi:exo-beta-N-acetylmuramidase NamZ domain-containing protein [Sandaracinus amylolyticus]|uniref:DUF1343 domain-containing protein n=1 Tax=Sandaracinus amylolyticus TaxID=927083 RepID=A0A0F6YJG7_9BACT|nr:DUF1343 domain-containing protein [Sandaracinus amylolyticus]AKF07310.1 Hypothetical protein DB32_004459 [Sandaracinus amylolyticus]
MTRTGLERVARGEVTSLRGRRVGLVAHPASVTSTFEHASSVLTRAGAEIVAYFGPEHGFGGEAQDMIGVGDARAPDGAPIHTLYGDSFASLSPTPAQLAGIDALVIDLQDVGSRYYTFVWTAALCLEAASALGITTVILDRPNPLGGVVMEGAPQRAGYRSFVGLHDVPVRHAMTIGEIVTMVASLRGIDALEVVTMDGWDATRGWELPWVLPSPNMPTLDTARVYPGGCLIEGTNLSEGRGTTRPFEIFGAPFVDGRALARDVVIEGAVLRPLTFSPTFHKHAKMVCGGVQVHVTDEARFAPYAAYVRMLAAIARAHRGDFAWRTERYEFVDHVPAIDLLCGGPEVREAIDAGADVDAILDAERDAVARFGEERRAWLLYPR